MAVIRDGSQPNTHLSWVSTTAPKVMRGQVPWESLVPSPGHIIPMQLLVLFAGVSGPHGGMLAMAMECTGLKVNWVASALTLSEQ